MHIDTELDFGPCHLRPLRPEDVPTFARHANNPKVAEYLRDRFPHPYTEEDARRFLLHAGESREECVAAIIADGEPAGAISIQFRTDIERCSAELGYWLAQPFWGRGIATAAIQCFTEWAMPRFDLTRIYAEVFAENPASSRVLEKTGFQFVGLLRKAAIKHGRYCDYRLYDFVR